MRQLKILTRTLLILSIIGFALAAPAAARDRPEGRFDVDITSSVAAASQKRWDPLDGELPPPKVPTWDHPPPTSPNLAEILPEIEGQLAKQNEYTDIPQHPPDGPESSTGSRLPVGSMPAAGPLSLPPQPESQPLKKAKLTHAPPPNSDVASIMSQIKEQLADQHRYTSSQGVPLDSIGSFVWSQMPEKLAPAASSLSRPKDPPPSPPQPDLPRPRRGRPLGSLGKSKKKASTGKLPTTPLKPGVNSETQSSLNLESLPADIKEAFLKGKFKPRSGPGLKVTDILTLISND